MDKPKNIFHYVFVVNPFGYEIHVRCKSYKEAHDSVWNALTDDEKDNTSDIELVDVLPE